MEKVAEEKITPEEADVRMLLSCQAHLGCKAITMHMTPYVHGRNETGVYIINPKLTLEKIRLAARIICGIENPADVCVVSGRTYGQRAVLKFAHYTGCTALATRFTPGTFTNQIQKRYLEPRLLLVTDPITDHQPIVESSYVNIPVIAICDTDSPLKYVDVAIPANNKGKHQIGIIYWMLAREVLRIRGELPYKKAWDVMPDLFFYRETVERQKKEEEEAAEAEETVFLESGRGGRSTGQQIPDEERDYMARSERGEAPAAPPAAAVSWAGMTEPAAGESWADASGGAAAGAGGGWGGEVF